MSQLFHVKVTAIGEVRDADGNLISSEPVNIETEMTQAELDAAGLTPEEK